MVTLRELDTELDQRLRLTPVLDALGDQSDTHILAKRQHLSCRARFDVVVVA